MKGIRSCALQPAKLVFAILLIPFLGQATPLQIRVEEFLKPRLAPVPAAPENAATATVTVLARPDPETFFSRYIFGLQRNAAKLLTPKQTAQLKQIIENRSPIGLRWHDERNTLRCKFNEVMWRYAAASEADATALREELANWMRLRMDWTLQEHVAEHEFDRAVWGILDAVQQQHLLAGDWKPYAKLDTGHQRANATGKIITRALGKPDYADHFTQELAAWERQRAPLHQALQTAENNARRVGFAMDVNSPGLFRTLTDNANAAYTTLYLAEADAMRRLIQAGYEKPQALCAKAAAEAWAEAPKRFQSGAAELMSLFAKP